LSLFNYVVILICVAGIASGQVLFKYSANALAIADRPWDMSVAVPLGAALAIYGVTTIGWVWVLQHVPLSRAYPFMALSFVLVPAASRFLFGEQLDVRYILGVCFICVGMVLAGR